MLDLLGLLWNGLIQKLIILDLRSDGLLYFGTGDVGGAGDKHGSSGNAHDPNLSGKILSINVNQENLTVILSSLDFEILGEVVHHR